MNRIVLHFYSTAHMIKARTIALNKLSLAWTYGRVFPGSCYMIIDLDSYHISHTTIYIGKEPIIEVE